MKKLATLKGDKGFTLVELLATISLLGLVVVLAYSFIFQGLNSEEKTSNKIALNQKGNILISELRSQYYAGESDLCFQNTGEVTIKKYTIINGTNTLQMNDNCVVGVNKDEPLEVQLTLENSSKQELTLEAAWENTKPAQMTLVVTKPDEDGGQIENPDDLEWIELDELPCLDDTDYNNKNIKWTTNILAKDCNNNGHGTYKNLWATGIERFETHSKITVGENALFQKPLEIKNKTILDIGNDAIFKGKIELQGQAELAINGNATFDRQLEAIGNEKITISGNGVFNEEVTIKGSANMFIFKNASFNAGVSVKDQICVNGTVTPNDNGIEKCT